MHFPPGSAGPVLVQRLLYSPHCCSDCLICSILVSSCCRLCNTGPSSPPIPQPWPQQPDFMRTIKGPNLPPNRTILLQLCTSIQTDTHPRTHARTHTRTHASNPANTPTHMCRQAPDTCHCLVFGREGATCDGQDGGAAAHMHTQAPTANTKKGEQPQERNDIAIAVVTPHTHHKTSLQPALSPLQPLVHTAAVSSPLIRELVMRLALPCCPAGLPDPAGPRVGNVRKSVNCIEGCTILALKERCARVQWTAFSGGKTRVHKTGLVPQCTW